MEPFFVENAPSPYVFVVFARCVFYSRSVCVVRGIFLCVLFLLHSFAGKVMGENSTQNPLCEDGLWK